MHPPDRLRAGSRVSENGDSRVTVPLVDLGRQSEQLRHEIAGVIESVLASQRFILGPQVGAFEEEFARYCRTRHCIGVGNGTDALEIALCALECDRKSEVITVANAGMYAASAIVAVGARPVLADIDPLTMTIAPQSAERCITRRTKAIVVTHLYGRLADMEAMLTIAGRHGIAVVEDCAQAHGAERNGRRAGSWGAIGCFSFYPTKNLGALGDGGALVTSEEELAMRIRALRQYGWVEKYVAKLPRGRNSRLDELQAAILRVKLPHLDRWNARRREIVQRYRTAAGKTIVAPDASGHDTVAHFCVVRSPQREKLRQWLARDGISTDIHYPIPDHHQSALREFVPSSLSLPATEQAAREILTVPCFPDLAEAEIEQVCMSLARFAAQADAA